MVREDYKRITDGDGVEKTDTGWIIYPVSESGVIDWANSAWTPSIISYEELFVQDLNSDGGIGLTNITLPVVDTDKSGLQPDFGNKDYLFLDTSNGLYILPDGSSTYIPITDSYGGTPSFDYSWGNNSVSSSSIAAESQADGSFLLAVKRIENFNNQASRTNWELFPINSDGILDWENGEWVEDIDLREPLFRQDLNGDGVLGFNIASLDLVNVGEADSNGVLLQRSGSGSLYIKVDSDTLLPITDEWGSSVSINFSTKNYSESPVAIRQVNVDGTISYVLAMKTIFTHSGREEINWNLVPIDDAGVMYWNNQLYTQSIAVFEKDFGWDLNEDSVTGINHTRNESYEFFSGSDSGSVFAVALQDSDTPGDLSDDFYLLLVKQVSDFSDSGEETYWHTYRISLEGIIDWDSGVASSSIAPSEIDFDQDLNNDGTKGIRQAALTSLNSDAIGAKLKIYKRSYSN